MNESRSYASAWSDYRRRRRWFFGVWLGGLLVVALFASVLMKFSFGDVAFGVFGPAWLLAFTTVALRLEFFRCPRCHHWFFCKWYRNSPFRRSCIHCGLPKWSEIDRHEDVA
jgi:hypothetical protein